MSNNYDYYSYLRTNRCFGLASRWHEASLQAEREGCAKTTWREVLECLMQGK